MLALLWFHPRLLSSVALVAGMALPVGSALGSFPGQPWGRGLLPALCMEGWSRGFTHLRKHFAPAKLRWHDLREGTVHKKQFPCLHPCSSSKPTQPRQTDVPGRSVASNSQPRKTDVPGRSVASNSLQPHGLQPTRLLCPRGFSRQEHWSGLPYPLPGGLPNPGIEPRSSTLRLDSFTS